MKLENISKTLNTQLGSIIKIEMVDILDINTIGRANEFNELPANQVVLNAGKTWKALEIIADCELVDKTEDTEHGPLTSITIEGSTMVEPKEEAKLYRTLNARLCLKVTDGNGYVYLLGNKTEFIKFAFEKPSGQTRAVAKKVSFSAKGTLTGGAILLL